MGQQLKRHKNEDYTTICILAFVGSMHEKFVVYPFVGSAIYNQQQLAFLAASGIAGGVTIHIKPTNQHSLIIVIRCVCVMLYSRAGVRFTALAINRLIGLFADLNKRFSVVFRRRYVGASILLIFI